MPGALTIETLMTSTSDNFRSRIAASLIFAGHGAAFGVWAGSVPRIRDLWGLRDGPLGLLLLAVSLGAFAAMPIGGWLATRFGPARVALLAGLASAPLLAAPALTHSLPVQPNTAWFALLASGGVLGVATGTMNIAMNAQASAIERRAGRELMSGMHGGWSCGGLLGSGLAAACTAFGFSTMQTLASGSISLVILVVAVKLLLSDDLAPDVTIARPIAGPAAGVYSLLPLGVMAALCFVLEGALADWSGIFMRDVHAVPVALASGTYSGIALAMMLARLGGDAARRRLGSIAVVRLGGCLTAAAMAAVLLAPSVAMVLLGFAAVGLGVANIVPVVFSAAGARAGAGGIAVVASVGYAGLLAGPPVIGFAAQAFTLQAALWLLVADGAILAMLAGFVVQPRK